MVLEQTTKRTYLFGADKSIPLFSHYPDYPEKCLKYQRSNKKINFVLFYIHVGFQLILRGMNWVENEITLQTLLKTFLRNIFHI